MAWTEKTKQAKTWNAQVQQTRGFDPVGFDNSPRFDTGSSSGIWVTQAKQPEAWIE